MEPNYRKETSQHPSLEVYFWYHHQNFYKTFSDNNILKEEPCFCACTGSPQKCFRSEYSKKNKNPNKKKKKKRKKRKEKPTTNQLPKKTMQRIFTPYRNGSRSAGKWWGGDSGFPWICMKSAFSNTIIRLESARKQRLILIIVLPVCPSRSTLQWAVGPEFK